MMSDLGIKETLAPILRVLNDLGGSLIFSDDSGEQFVIMRRRDVEAKGKQNDKQLKLPSAHTLAAAIRRNVPGEIGDDVLERINRDIAITNLREQAETDDLAISSDNDTLDYRRPTPPPIRFEPIKGDLPPELQE